MHKGNHLITETSPYLLQHAYNPVEWYPWGDEALNKAKQEDKPILVSIGYSACHWCHVMERESFEDNDTATLMNSLFVNIKIDREERPDLDHVYMEAVQLIAGNGGWPLNVFLTPDKKPFYGGTYFPPVTAFNRSSWKDVLNNVNDLFKNKRNEVEAQADDLLNHIQKSNPGAILPQSNVDEENSIFSELDAEVICNNLLNQVDFAWGGFGSAPKFPQTFSINYLLRYYHFTKNSKALQAAVVSLDKMIYGGIYDQLGGGFARYSTDREWLAPHFEKMLYDNALLISTLVDAFLITGHRHYKLAVDETIEFVKRELLNVDGGFYAALDADSEGIEGKFYVWKYDEIKEILGEEADIFCTYYDVSVEGNWEHSNILRILRPLSEFAAEHSLDEYQFEQKLASCKRKLLAVRSTRVRPATDDKIILSWNALMNVALAKAAGAFANNDYNDLAINNFRFLWQSFYDQSSGQLKHTFKNGEAKHPGFLDDYAFLIQSCIYLQELTSDQSYLEKAFHLTDIVLENFNIEEGSGFYYTGKTQDDIVVRKNDIYDSALPSGNSVMAQNLLYLSLVLNKSEWKNKALINLAQMINLLKKYPSSFGNWACAFINQVFEVNEISVIGLNYTALRNELLQYFVPNKVLQSSEELNDSFPLLSHKAANDKTLIYLCKNYSCQSPEANVGNFMKKLDEQTALRTELQ
ncbi:MAG: thioredoxin domain-containing protein [Ginsengibacter sp.]